MECSSLFSGRGELMQPRSWPGRGAWFGFPLFAGKGIPSSSHQRASAEQFEAIKTLRAMKHSNK